MALTFISRDNFPTYFALSTDIVSDEGIDSIPGATQVGKTVYLTDSSEWKIILPNGVVVDFLFPANVVPE